ncbi:MAG: hypothetical protein WBQ25_17680 [Nitrososphaeraceae archaeon]
MELVKQVKKMDMKPKPEVSMMYGAGAGTHISGYKTKLKRLDDFLDEIGMHERWC